ncbi:MAG: gamma-glutamylcyclotransferase [Planctomycetota bacterium]|nr:gamma-glutamylcyclotransferase [Planctomycetota bacterium]
MTSKQGGSKGMSESTLFAYGTLMFPDLLEAVVGRKIDAQPAELHDYARAILRGRTYPALAEFAGATTRGMLLRGIDAKTWRKLDAYEGPEYVRAALEVWTSDGESQHAQVYLLKPEHRGMLTAEPWDPESWRRAYEAQARSSGSDVRRDLKQDE